MGEGRGGEGSGRGAGRQWRVGEQERASERARESRGKRIERLREEASGRTGHGMKTDLRLPSGVPMHRRAELGKGRLDTAFDRRQLQTTGG